MRIVVQLAAYSSPGYWAGFVARMAIALPVALSDGMSPLMYKALNPYIQFSGPISAGMDAGGPVHHQGFELARHLCDLYLFPICPCF